ncbi:efflux RND transporter periplasmic adaptor subunit [Acidisphaera rubrifaciens]|uniref:RND family efflux transporter HlyD n=1 Tax=Acidisphaera rubrifaciens HS-AP3 TaxID=1231350 RepID=A0A0D6P8D3_9PROT|nr:efflux RND transporter periplasmic adaptor subunit [Acidisphaera rubrifaciens]GAN77473.1 RND family efflux transporter HlyD [Acidisphaera rubrifaciens HS-AP3]
MSITSPARAALAQSFILAAVILAPGILAPGILGAGAPAFAAVPTIVAQRSTVTDEKAVFATVESRNVVPARARIGGTVGQLRVRQGDRVTQGQVIAVVSDPKLQLQIQSLDAQIAGLKSQLAQAQLDLGRAQALAKSGAVSRETLDKAETASRVATSLLAARIAERAVTAQQINEGEVLAPSAGRVLEVPVIDGSVVLPGDSVATVAEQDYVLRLSVPERHAQFMRLGDTVRFDRQDIGGEAAGPAFGRITLIYPLIQDGRVRVDATATGVGDYFVGERIRVWVSAGTRQTYVIPSSYVLTRFGLDFVRLRASDGHAIDIQVQRGRVHPTPAMPDGLEILSGLTPGEVLEHP